mgnify:CR=1 FL=1
MQTQDAEVVKAEGGYTTESVPVSPLEALRLESEGMSIAHAESERPQPSQISEAIRKEVMRVVSEGDRRNGGAFTMSVAAHVERLVVAAKDILVAERIADNDLEALLRSRRRRNGLFDTVGGSEFGGSLMGEAELGPVVASSATENFGASFMRQIVDALTKLKPDEAPEKTVAALAEAERLGLKDVAASLRAKLGVYAGFPSAGTEDVP